MTAPTTSDPKAVEVSALVKRYGDTTVVDDVSFSIERGEVFVLLGPNGAGKTTTVEIVEGLRPADGGRATVLGIEAPARKLAKRIGVMPQEGDLWAGIRAEEALRLFASFYDEPFDTGSLIEQLGLESVRRSQYRRLSGGEKRRLSLALALVGRPEVAFLDEPTAGMDVEGRSTAWEIIDGLRTNGSAVLVTTHQLDEAERVADRVGILHRGRLVALGPLADLLADRTQELEFTVTARVEASELSRELGVPVQVIRRDAYRMPGTEPSPELIARLTRWLADRNVLLRSLDVGPRSLEDLYLSLTR